jgi:hypothetical protein
MKKSITRGLLSIAGVFAAMTFAQADPINLNGRWVMGDGEGILEIHGKNWSHPKYGSAQIQYGTGASDIEVFYIKEQGVRCAYRVNTIADGDILVLESTDTTQSANYCPTGKLSRADK